MTWTERNRYQASWGAWYVQIEIDGQVVELKFNHSPSTEEIDPIAEQVWLSMQPPEPTIGKLSEMYPKAVIRYGSYSRA